MTARPVTRKMPARRLTRSQPPRKQRLGWRSRLILISVFLVFALFSWAALARLLAPASNTSLTRFDAIIVLGSPVDRDGNPTPDQLAGVNEGVHEYERGVAPRLIFTGGPVRNQYVEARVMARTAEAEGIPQSAIFVEPNAKDTIQNACYAVRIMKAHGWRSAEVVSRARHLPRAAMIFNNMPVEWRTHAAPPVEPESAAHAGAAELMEVVKTMRYLTWARWFEHCEP